MRERTQNGENMNFNAKHQKGIYTLLTVGLAAFAIVLGIFAVSLDSGSVPNEGGAAVSSAESAASKPNESSQSGQIDLLSSLPDDNSSVQESQKPAENEWNLILVNGRNPIPQEYEIELVEVENGHMVDYRIADSLKSMLADARAAGILPKITSSYRTDEDQIEIMNDYIADYIADGYTQEEAELEAMKWVALPGTSEHQIGLAVDISTADWNKQSAYTVWEWLENNCYQYGFILRYTEEWQTITGTSPEPWHFRYVGIEAATEITKLGVSLEEYLEQAGSRS